MAHTYTPGLRVTPYTAVRRRRLLPLPGQVLVEVGDQVAAEDVVARTELPGAVHPVNVINKLGITAGEIKDFMCKQEGETIEAGETLAETRPLIKWFKSSATSPVAGTVENISTVTGQVILREPPKPLEVRAYVDGTVVEVLEGSGVEVEARGAFLQGILGVGGETLGELVVVVDSPDQELDPGLLTEAHRGKVVVGGSYASGAVMSRARELQVAGIVVGGIHDQDLRALLGYDLGVAITGHEDVGFTLVITEGFGKVAMAHRTFELLGQLAGRRASLSGATQIRAGVLRPEIIVPLAEQEVQTEATEREGLQRGDTIRVIRAPYFGRLATVTDLPAELTRLPSESRVRVLEAEFEDGTRAVLPRANVEVLQS
jgi:hypothetical protein